MLKFVWLRHVWVKTDLKTSSERMWCPQRRFCYLKWWWWALANPWRNWEISQFSYIMQVWLSLSGLDLLWVWATQTSFNVLVVWCGVTVGLWEESQASMGRTWKLHTERPHVTRRFKTRTFMLWGDSVLTTAPLCIRKQSFDSKCGLWV